MREIVPVLQVLADAALGLAFLVMGHEKRRQACGSAGAVQPLVALLWNHEVRVVEAAACCLAHLAAAEPMRQQVRKWNTAFRGSPFCWSGMKSYCSELIRMPVLAAH